MKRLLVVVAVAILLVGLAPSARAGVGASQICSDGSQGEVSVVNWPITLNLEGGTPGGTPYLEVCYSTTPNGDSSPAVAGGHVWLSGGGEDLHCRDDAGTLIAVTCAIVWGPLVTVILTPRVQGMSAPIGIQVSSVEGPACLRDLTVYTVTGSLGAFDVGVCS